MKAAIASLTIQLETLENNARVLAGVSSDEEKSRFAQSIKEVREALAVLRVCDSGGTFAVHASFSSEDLKKLDNQTQ